MKKNRKKLIVILVVLLIVALFALWFAGIPYIKRHYITKTVDRAAAIQGETVETDARVLTVYFTRVGNSDFEPDVDAVSGASLMTDNGELIGNSQLLAEMIQNAASGDLYAIRTEKHYPSTYSGTISAARKEMNAGERVALLGELPDLTDYDALFVVYPVWWMTTPLPINSFFEQVTIPENLKIYPVPTHGGSGVSSSVKDLRALVGPAVQDAPADFFDDDVTESRPAIVKMLRACIGK